MSTRIAGDKIMCKYVKVRFESETHGATAALVIATDRFKKMTIGELSELYPLCEVMKMKRLVVSPEYSSWDEAFDHQFDHQFV